jgi:hypothetical protein
VRGIQGEAVIRVHFVVFRGEEYWSAVGVWGRPDFIHRKWDLRAQREIGPDDIVVFARGEWADKPSRISGDDIREKYLLIGEAEARRGGTG